MNNIKIPIEFRGLMIQSCLTKKAILPSLKNQSGFNQNSDISLGNVRFLLNA